MINSKKVQLIEIPSERAGQRLDNFLINMAKGVPKSRIYRAIRKGEVRVNKKRAKPEYKLEAADLIRVPPLRIREKKNVNIKSGTIEWIVQHIIYEDEELLVINKPAGISVHAGTHNDFGIIEALRQAKSEYEELELAHRLDKDTSGCLIIAKTRASLKQLHQLLRDGHIDKEYTCLVKGQWQGQCQQVVLPLRKNILQSGERIVRVDPLGKEAITEFILQKKFSTTSLIHAKLLTGRTHQIRVHLQHLQHPIVGDSKYGDRTFNKQMNALGLKRMFLHAHRVKFRLPDRSKAITVTAPLDDDLQRCLHNLT